MLVVLPSQEIKKCLQILAYVPWGTKSSLVENHSMRPSNFVARKICIGSICCSGDVFYFLGPFAHKAFRAGHVRQEGFGEASRSACDSERVTVNENSYRTYSHLCTQHPHLLGLFPITWDRAVSTQCQFEQLSHTHSTVLCRHCAWKAGAILCELRFWNWTGVLAHCPLKHKEWQR